MNKLAIGAIVLCVAGLPRAWAAETPLQNIRISKDGAGPSHIFWLAGPSEILPDRDVVGIVDPLLAAIRLYSVRRSTPNGDDINDRLKPIGACALPVPFRPWRVLQLKNEIHIEGMPQPGKNGHNAEKKDFQSTVYVLRRDLVNSKTIGALQKARWSIDEITWNPNDDAFVKCGDVKGADGAAGRTAAFKATRVTDRTITLENTAAALTGAQRLTVRARTGGKYYLFSIRELEPAPSARVVLITEGAPTRDGMLRLNQRLLLFGKDGSKPVGEISFDDTHFRNKIGQKPLAVMPTGEVLAMGKQITGDHPESVFRIQSCGFVGLAGGAIEGPLCANESNVAVSRQDADPAPSPGTAGPGPGTAKGKAGSTTGENARSIFSRVSKLAAFKWNVDTTWLPKECRSINGCKVGNQTFVPLKGIRLTRGQYFQTGIPYAQTKTLEDYDRFYDAFRDNLFTDALRNVMTMQGALPGNLDDHFTGDLGIDCSALVQLAWNGRNPEKRYDRISTETLQNGSMDYRCAARIPAPSYLKSGDAIGISVKQAAEHAVLYAANVPFDGASEFWLVLESASSCDGVCWSVYDPSFFNGWGLYRAKNRKDTPCLKPNKENSIAKAQFPSDFPTWRDNVVKGLPLRKKSECAGQTNCIPAASAQ
jgi:hypothetical protein